MADFIGGKSFCQIGLSYYIAQCEIEFTRFYFTVTHGFAHNVAKSAEEKGDEKDM